MVKNMKNDLRINGLGNSSGGNYNYVQINGKGDINGDLDCVELQINGLGCIHGNVKTRTARVAGKSEINGSVKAEDLIIDGMTEIGGAVSADRIENRGMLKVNKDCGAETFRSQGGFTIGGLLNADKIDIEMYVASRAREIGGQEIEIKAGSAFGFKKFLSSLFPMWQMNRYLSVETIEGDNIYLENVTVKVVRGGNVKVGPGCQIDKVEYKNTFYKDRDSSVKENKKV
ncbi:MAG TPA: polymer-forming cytoskeletal protein [Candidatus Acidoferrales bacterium]|nr:polymer-forming cytoskeletal protein [Candidatus Acidoferrales bacterium]